MQTESNVPPQSTHGRAFLAASHATRSEMIDEVPTKNPELVK
jgi:hypothetical protein